MIGESYNDYYGHAVACSSDGDTIIVGAYGGNYGGFNQSEGAAYVYVWNTGTNSWDSKGSRIDGTTNYEFLGYSVSMSSDGNLIAIGGYEHGDAVGRVQVFEWIDASGEWYQKGSDMSGSFPQNRMGKTVALSGSGNVVAMGTSDGKNDNGVRVGHVLVFEWVDVSGDWYQRGQTMNGDATNDSFGMALAISYDGSTIAIGAPGVDQISNADGRGYVYEWEYSTSGEWSRIYQYSLPFWVGSYAYMGTSVSLSHDGNMFAICGYNAQGIENDTNKYGLVQVFERNTSTNVWTQVGSNIINTVLGQIGYRVKLSADGLTLVTGGNNGYFQVMTYTNGDWEMQEDEIRLTTTGGHQISVDMSSDGTKVIAGNSKDGTYETGKAVPYIYA